MSSVAFPNSLGTYLPRPKPWIMGVLNLTPDSFSDGGLYYNDPMVIETVRTTLLPHSDIIDIGGESTAPGCKAIGPAEEIERIREVIAALANDSFLSVDTYKAQTAEIALQLGARMINDVSALRFDSNLASVVKNHDSFIVLMHSKESSNNPHATFSERVYTDLINEVADFLRERIDYALKAGIASTRIILDPGFGRFLSHDPLYSWKLLEELSRLIQLLEPFPILIGTSRKGFLGCAVEDQDALSQLTGLLGVLQGASIIRTHNPRMARLFINTWEQMSSKK